MPQSHNDSGATRKKVPPATESHLFSNGVNTEETTLQQQKRSKKKCVVEFFAYSSCSVLHTGPFRLTAGLKHLTAVLCVRVCVRVCVFVCVCVCLISVCVCVCVCV